MAFGMAAMMFAAVSVVSVNAAIWVPVREMNPPAMPAAVRVPAPTVLMVVRA